MGPAGYLSLYGLLQKYHSSHMMLNSPEEHF